MPHKVRIIGFNHDDLVSGGKAGITFEFANVITDKGNEKYVVRHMAWGGQYDSGYVGSGIYYKVNDFYDRDIMDQGLKSNIKKVIKGVQATGKKEALPSELNCFLLGTIELDNNPRNSPHNEGKLYTYYKYNHDLSKTSAVTEIKKSYWLRSANLSDMSLHFGSSAYFVNEDGGIYSTLKSDLSTDRGFSPAFCI